MVGEDGPPLAARVRNNQILSRGEDHGGDNSKGDDEGGKGGDGDRGYADDGEYGDDGNEDGGDGGDGGDDDAKLPHLLGWVQVSQAQSVSGKTDGMMDSCAGGGEVA